MASRARRLNVDPNGRDLGRCGLYRPRAVEVPAWDHFDAGSASVLTGRSGVAARQALNNLADSGVLEQVTVGKRNRMWESIGRRNGTRAQRRTTRLGRNPITTRSTQPAAW
jgi:hypothetical protein